MKRCCKNVAKHITCHNGCYELVDKNGLCTKCLGLAKRKEN